MLFSRSGMVIHKCVLFVCAGQLLLSCWCRWWMKSSRLCCAALCCTASSLSFSRMKWASRRSFRPFCQPLLMVSGMTSVLWNLHLFVPLKIWTEYERSEWDLEKSVVCLWFEVEGWYLWMRLDWLLVGLPKHGEEKGSSENIFVKNVDGLWLWRLPDEGRLLLQDHSCCF